MSKFLLLQSRPEEQVSDDELQAFCKFGNINPSEIDRIQMHRVQPSVDLSKYDAVLMGGGPANFAYEDHQKSLEQQAFEPWLWKLLDEIIEKEIPFFGACLGIGALVTHAGGRMSFDAGEAVGAVEVRLSDHARSDDIFVGVPDKFNAFVGHKEGVREVPEGVTVLASSDNCIQMIRVGKNAYGTQFHPELDPAGLMIRIEAYKYAGYFKPEEYDELVSEIWKTDVDDTATLVLKNFIAKFG